MTAFVYKWTHKPTLGWYVGSRTAKECHTEDGYICSSKVVKPMIQTNPTEWERTILAIGTPKEMRMLETLILETIDAMNDPRSFNQNNGNGILGNTGKQFSQAHKNAKSVSAKIAMNRPDTKAAIRAANIGKTLSEETKKKKSEKMKIWHANPINQQRHSETMKAAMTKPGMSEKLSKAHKKEAF
jgi:hypothetical protein